MESFIIEGGLPARGVVRPGGNKNEALPCLAACLLTDQEVHLKNVPRIRDVEAMMALVASVGAEVEWSGPNSVRIKAVEITETELDRDLCSRIRASILLAGPMVSRAGRVCLPPPGGDVIGRRRVDTHFAGFAHLGVKVEVDHSYLLQVPPEGLSGTDIFLDEASVTATENLVTTAVRAKGVTVLRNVAMEPHVQGLCRMLNLMGAQIEGIGTPTLIISGVSSLHGCSFTLGPDYLEVGSFLGLAAVTGGDISIEGVRSDDLRMIRLVFQRLGVNTSLAGETLNVHGGQPLNVRMDYHNQIPTIDDSPWPAFPTDLMSIAITVATQANGTVLFFEKMFEGRMFFVDSLISMGAKIILCDPHRVVVVGPSELYGSTVTSPDIRAGMALLIAACAAKGQSTIYNIQQIDRGYENIDKKLKGLGLAIERQKA